MNVVIHLQCRGINQVTKPLQDLGNNLMSMLYITVTSCQKNKCSIIRGSPVWVLLSVWHLFFSQLSIFCFGWMYCTWTGRYKFVAVFFFQRTLGATGYVFILHTKENFKRKNPCERLAKQIPLLNLAQGLRVRQVSWFKTRVNL